MRMFMQGDKVMYVGHKFSSSLSRKMGQVVGHVEGEPLAVVVDFGDDAYILNESSLRRPNPSKDKGIEILRKKSYDEDLEN